MLCCCCSVVVLVLLWFCCVVVVLLLCLCCCGSVVLLWFCCCACVVVVVLLWFRPSSGIENQKEHCFKHFQSFGVCRHCSNEDKSYKRLRKSAIMRVCKRNIYWSL